MHCQFFPLSTILLIFCTSVFAQTGWKLSRVNSPMDDNSGIILEAAPVAIRTGQASEKPGFAIQCTKKDGLEIVFSTGSALVTSGNVNDSEHKGQLGGLFSKHSGMWLSPVRMRFDQQKPRREEWVKGADPSKLFAQKPKRFVDALLKDDVKVLLLEARPLADNPVVFEFDVRDLTQYKTILHDACGY